MVLIHRGSSGVREVEKDIGKNNLDILAFKQLMHLQLERERTQKDQSKIRKKEEFWEQDDQTEYNELSYF